jgi:hypothetical protein
MIRSLTILALVVLPAACGAPGGGAPLDVAALPEGAPGSCHARGMTAAVIETVTDQVREAEAVRAPDGRILSPARFRTETATRILRPRGVHWFETPCALADPDFVRQVQRALAARGLYGGEAHGRYDAATREAVAAYQAGTGPESGTLSMAAARSLGLVPVPRDDA